MEYSRKILILIISITLLSLAACTVVKPYQKAFLNDYDMALDGKAAAKYGQGIHSYREGASGALGGKSGGGCGCN